MFMPTGSEILEVILVSMRDAFLAVTVFVAAMVLLFSWIQYKTAGKFVEWVQEHKRFQPLFGALMGLTPGCGGAIIVMPMYTRGIVSYGTVIATLIATLGDSAFVLIGAAISDSAMVRPVLLVHVISLLVGVVWGYLVDSVGITPRHPFGGGSTFGEEAVEQAPEEVESTPASEVFEDLGREEPDGLAYKIVHHGYTIWWAVTTVGLVLAVLLLVWYAQDPDYAPELSWDIFTRDGLVTWIGFLGTSLSVGLYLASKNWIADDTEATIGDKLSSGRETMVHAASETAFVTFWVLIAYFVFEFGMMAVGMNEQDLATYGQGAFAVMVAATIGVIPGCGPQIITITAYTERIISFPALVANAISQDGDALFPLLVRHKRASLWATLHTTLPAILTGLVLLALGVQIP